MTTGDNRFLPLCLAGTLLLLVTLNGVLKNGIPVAVLSDARLCQRKTCNLTKTLLDLSI